MTSWCTGVQLANSWFLSASACWKGRSRGSNVNFFKGGEREVFHEAELEGVEFYPGTIDIALVKIRSDLEEVRHFPCILSSKGIADAVAEGSDGVALVRARENPRKQKSGKLKGVLYKMQNGAKCTKEKSKDVFCLKGTGKKDKDEKSASDDVEPFFVKAGRSRWALAGLGLPGTDGTLAVHTLYPAIRWIEQTLSS